MKCPHHAHILRHGVLGSPKWSGHNAQGSELVRYLATFHGHLVLIAPRPVDRITESHVETRGEAQSADEHCRQELWERRELIFTDVT